MSNNQSLKNWKRYCSSFPMALRMAFVRRISVLVVSRIQILFFNENKIDQLYNSVMSIHFTIYNFFMSPFGIETHFLISTLYTDPRYTVTWITN